MSDLQGLLFTRPLSSSADRWAALHALVQRFCNVELRPLGQRSRDAGSLESSAGRSFGRGVTAWLTFTEDLAQAERPAREILRDDRRIVVEDHRLILGIQAEGDRIWSVRKEDLGLDDPPVWIDWLDHATDTLQTSDEPDHSLTGFAGRYVFDYLGGGPTSTAPLPDGWCERMAATGVVRGDFDGLAVYEGQGWVAFLRPRWRTTSLRLVFHRDVAPDALPQPVRESYDELLATLALLG